MAKPKTDSLTFSAATFDGANFEAAVFGATEDSPLDDIEYTGDPAVDSTNELTAIKSAFQERAEREKKRQQKATDSEYWVCLCFQSRAQVEEFLSLARWGQTTDKYLDGQVVARKMGFALTPELTGFGRRKIDPKLADLSMDA
jgi:hypothetical protein